MTDEMKDVQRNPASFRDPSGFLFRASGVLYRQVNRVYGEHYDRLLESGLYRVLTDKGYLIPHREVAGPGPLPEIAYKIIAPEPLPFISYPYEWCFSQLRDAALLTLKIQKIALDHGLALKDASAYNIQFRNGKPILIDTLSFEMYREGEPWIAYRQFCQHFLAPLALMSLRDVRLLQLLRVHLDGVPLDLASCLLPARTRLRFSLSSHIHLHARSQRRYADRPEKAPHRKLSRFALQAIGESLTGAVRKLEWRPAGTEWGDYYEKTNYSPAALEHKKALVAEYLALANPKVVWDLGANLGLFSRLASDKGIDTVAWDIDPAAVEKNYRQCRRQKEAHILPLLIDLTNPSPGIGWENEERQTLLARGKPDAVMALALVHHLAIANNLPLESVARFFARLGRFLIVEFIPKSDSQVQRLLATREDIFPDYNEQAFAAEFQKTFTVERKTKVGDSERTLYLMRRIRES